MTRPVPAPFGTWTSLITPQRVAAAALRLGTVTIDGDDIYWVEARPEERGRSVVVRRSLDGRTADVTSLSANVRSRVHEYGGAAFAVHRRTIYYVEFSDQRVYRLMPGNAHAPEPLTTHSASFYADFAVDAARKRLVCVREDHTDGEREAINTLVSIPMDGPATAGTTLVSGHDFYSTPRLSPDGARLAWLAWRHPQMPWDGTELWIGDLARDGSIERSRLITGGSNESVFQPGWSPDGVLYFVSDRTGWWNLYRFDSGRVDAVRPMAADFGRPQWQLGIATWAVAEETRLVVTYSEKGRWWLATIDLSTGTLDTVPMRVEPGDSIAATRTHAVMVCGSSDAPDQIARVDLASGAVETLRTSSPVSIDTRLLSAPEAIEFATDGGGSAHAFYYEPCNPSFVGLDDERPPLIVVAHGGPTAATNARLNVEVQYWTSRGFAVVDVNYRGSTGYGRAYREALKGLWGVADVADCVNAARHLVEVGKADANRLIIRGRSAGGFTTLAVLTCDRSFAAGASYYGIANLELLARDTHKFESRYLDGLLGPFPEHREIYRERSPLERIQFLSRPLILFQGLDDLVVPPNQARLMADAVRAKGLPAVLLTFAGEQHGFRRAETIVRCLEAEFLFYEAVLGLGAKGTDALEALERLG